MATEEQKKVNQYRLMSMALTGLASGVWNTLGESSFAFSGPMGNEILHIMEKEMGLEVAGEDPQDVMTEIGRIFVDEFGFAGDITVEEVGAEHYELRVKNCINRRYTDQLLEAGVEKPFICPILNACQASLRRMGFKMHENVEKWVEGNGSVITFKGI
ncbi:MAG: hypothetical protein KC415_14800 [Anaerolineales bacterium]|nr:hypothetical protein [Anaerolineales bacterium]MCB8991426.1 hypothetical protein [Ardenticatenaceae bacterium]MCB9003954.1 hypothetical protein [Ardenticatenaceae bacterium]